MAFFSVLIANYNNGKYISAAIDSVIRQTFTDWEIVVVDDASDDHSIEVIDRYIKEGYPVTLHRHQANQGCGGTKNDCVAFSSGEICCFLDPDDALTDNALAVMAEAHRSHPSVSLVYSRFYFCDTELNIKRRADWVKPIPAGETNLLHDQAMAFVTFKRSAYDKTEGIGRQFVSAEDKDLYYKIEEVAPFLFIDQTLYLYRENRKGMSQFQNYITAQDNHLAVIESAMARRKISGFKSLTASQYKKLKSRIYLQRAELLVKLGYPTRSVFKWLMISWVEFPWLFNLLRVKYFIRSCFQPKSFPKV
jgi:glycosyltransferase involved in cell wall biosynthesis